jgi:hypothetical protein
VKTHVAGWALLFAAFALTPARALEPASYKVLKLEGNQVSWHQPAGGQPLVVSYSLVASTVDSPDARNCRKMTAPDNLLAASGLAMPALREEVASAFALWEAVANISFREAADDEPADILIGAQVDPEGWAFADVFYDTASSDSVKPISRALICLNPTKRWKIGFDGDLKTYDLRYTLAHEIGHAIGLDHPAGAGQIMGYRYEERFRTLQPGDVAGAVLLYGGPRADGVEVAADSQNQSKRPSTAERLGTRAFTARSR